MNRPPPLRRSRRRGLLGRRRPGRPGSPSSPSRLPRGRPIPAQPGRRAQGGPPRRGVVLALHLGDRPRHGHEGALRRSSLTDLTGGCRSLRRRLSRLSWLSSLPVRHRTRVHRARRIRRARDRAQRLVLFRPLLIDRPSRGLGNRPHSRPASIHPGPIRGGLRASLCVRLRVPRRRPRPTDRCRSRRLSGGRRRRRTPLRGRPTDDGRLPVSPGRLALNQPLIRTSRGGRLSGSRLSRDLSRRRFGLLRLGLPQILRLDGPDRRRGDRPLASQIGQLILKIGDPPPLIPIELGRGARGTAPRAHRHHQKGPGNGDAQPRQSRQHAHHHQSEHDAHKGAGDGSTMGCGNTATLARLAVGLTRTGQFTLNAQRSHVSHCGPVHGLDLRSTSKDLRAPAADAGLIGGFGGDGIARGQNPQLG